MEKYIFKVNNHDARTTFMEVVCGIFITNFEQVFACNQFTGKLQEKQLEDVRWIL